MTKKLYLYEQFERFWHWSQALLIFLLAFTGFEIHGCYSLIGFDNAVLIHDGAAYTLIALIAFAIFWHITTGEWKQYVPTTEKFVAQIQYYMSGIFKGDPHPTHKSRARKFNPLQAVTYLAFKVLIIPLLLASGVVYMLIGGPLGDTWRAPIGIIHTFGAFVVIAFVIVHVYMTTTGDTVFSNIKAMIFGYEEVPEDYDEDSSH